MLLMFFYDSDLPFSYREQLMVYIKTDKSQPLDYVSRVIVSDAPNSKECVTVGISLTTSKRPAFIKWFNVVSLELQKNG